MMFVTRAVYRATTRIACFMSRQLKRSARTETRVLSPAKKRREDARALPKLSQNETGALGEFRTKCFPSAMRPRIAFMVCSKASLRDDTQMARRASSNIQSQKEMTPRTASKPVREANARTISWSPAELLCAVAVFLAALVVYIWTLAPTVTLVDSGELIVVAQGLGVAHPPGFPLWVMLAHLASLLPFGNVAVRINFSSALFAALASAVLTLVVAELIITGSFVAPSEKRRVQQRKSSGDSRIGRLLIFAPAAGAGLLMAFSRTLWSYATITEVYTLNTLLILAVFFLMFRWRRCIIAERKDTGAMVTKYDNWLYAAG